MDTSDRQPCLPLNEPGGDAPHPLFRTAALDAQRTKTLGDIVLVQPVTYSMLAAVAGIIAALIVGFLVFGQYTRRVTVAGQLVPLAGMVKVYSSQPGIIIEERVVEGQSVQRGDVLFVVSSERRSSLLGETQAEISRQAQRREQSLREQVAQTRRLAELERRSIAQRRDGLKAELDQIETLLAAQQERLRLAEEVAERYRGLRAAGFVSSDAEALKHADLLEQRARLQTIERERSELTRSLSDTEGQLATLPIKYENQLADLERSISSTAQELTESEARRHLLVVAPEDGTAAAVVARLGQTIDPNQPLVSIVPAGAPLQAHLYAPTRAIGFVRPGDTVRLRYQAFPYQKFGQAVGRVSAVATTALSSPELTGTNMFALGGSAGEPLYRISVDLAEQSIKAYGVTRDLQAGMLLEADVLGETRRLYEWVLEPVYSLAGKL